MSRGAGVRSCERKLPSPNTKAPTADSRIQKTRPNPSPTHIRYLAIPLLVRLLSTSPSNKTSHQMHIPRINREQILGGNALRLACKPRSVPLTAPLSRPRSGAAIISLGRALPPASSSLPGTPTVRAAPCGRHATGSLLLGLAPGGVCLAGPVARAAGEALTSPFHPYRPCRGRRLRGTAVCFLWHFPSGYPAWPLASTMLCGARTFLEPLRLRRRSGPQPPSQPEPL